MRPGALPGMSHRTASVWGGVGRGVQRSAAWGGWGRYQERYDRLVEAILTVEESTMIAQKKDISPKWANLAPGMKTLEDAIAIKNGLRF